MNTQMNLLFKLDELFAVQVSFINPTLTLKDVFTLAGGLNREASKQDRLMCIEFDDNNSTKVLATNISVDEDLNLLGGDDFSLQTI